MHIIKMKESHEELNNKFLIAIFILAIFSIAIVFFSYFYFFNYEISNKQEIWGVFGDFIGGTLNPILSFLALIALLITIVVQNKQLYLSRKELELTKIELQKTAKATQRQANHFEKEARRADIYRIIEKLSTRINKNYNEDRIDSAPNGGRALSVHSALKKGENVNNNKELKWLYENYQNMYSDTYRTVKWLEIDLTRLSHYITSYEEASETEKLSTPFPEFYRFEFGNMVKVFYQLGMLKKELYDFYYS